MMPGPMHYDDLPMGWVGDWAGRRAAITPRRVALYDAATDTRYTYADMNERANRVGTWLVDRLGLKKGDKLCFIARNRIETIDLYLACGKTGIILAPLSHRLTKRELDDLIARIQPQALFHEDVFAELAESLALPASVGKHVIWADGDSDWTREVLATEPRDVNVALAQSDPYRQMLWNSLDIIVTASGVLGQQRELLTFPLFHIGGWNTFTPMFHAGGYTVLLRQFEPEQVLDLIEREQITHFGAVEAMLLFLARHPRFRNARLDSLHGITAGGAPCSPPAMQPFWERGIPVTQSYGLTEAGPSNFTYGAIDHSLDEVWKHNASIGTTFFHNDYRIVDQQSGQPVAHGEIGVLCIRSLHNFGGYLDQPERTEQVLLDGGWVWSGDLAREDEQGYVYIVGRADNMFITGGENVSPEEIENILREHASVADAAVIAMADENWGQVPLAVIVLVPGAAFDEKALAEHCRRYLAGYKIPRRFLVTDALPMAGPGKVDRNALTTRYGA
jgi:fatty-acyl-CoA synthase